MRLAGLCPPVILCLAACGPHVAASPSPISSPSSAATVAASPPPPETSPAVWTPLSNKSGSFSLRYPPSWGAFGCEIPQSAPYALLGPELMGVSSPCGHDEFVPTLLVIEYPTATPQGQQPGESVGDIGGSTSVPVDGVLGTRQTATVTVDTGL